jgi:hypothetical protein
MFQRSCEYVRNKESMKLVKLESSGKSGMNDVRGNGRTLRNPV